MKQREYGLDLVRAAAAVLVLTVHFFMNCGFYSAPFEGNSMLVAAVLRMASMTCVPLFMVLSGYLCINRRWSRGYLKGLLPVLLTYVLAAVCCLAFRQIWLGQQLSFGTMRILLFDFSAAPYGWYVEMYIGLFLLMPFLNAAWHGLEEGGRKALLAVLAAMTALPLLFNQGGQVLPDWWTGVYPLTYYFAGAWLREHPLKVKSGWLLLGWLGVAAAAGLLQYRWQLNNLPGASFLVVQSNYWGSLLTLVETVCLFSLLRRFDGSRTPQPVRRCVSRVAALSLPIYLMSYITDCIIYPVLNGAVGSMLVRILFLPLMVAISLVCSGLMAQAVDKAVGALMKLLPQKKETSV